MSHPVVVTFLILAITAFLSWAGDVFKPLALAILLTFALAPLCRLLEKQGLPRAASVVLTVIIALCAIGFIGLKVGQQLSSLVAALPNDEDKVLSKIRQLKQGQGNSIESLNLTLEKIATAIEPKSVEVAEPVRIVDRPSLRQQLVGLVGPYLEFLGTTAFVLILVLFFLMNREDLGDRLIRLFGRGKISLTTKTMDEVGQKISRYLVTFSAVNSTFGLIVGVGLWVLGIPYAFLWGVLAALLRFIPYAGPASAFLLPLIYSIAHFSSWNEPLRVIGLFAVLEIIANSFLEPVIYGRMTGVSALGLLVAAMFWTWLWGPLGLLLSTPLTVCLAVLGKYVPSLGFLAIILGEEAILKPDVRYYQRILAHDSDGATALTDDALKDEDQSHAKFFDEVVIPTLSLAERDFTRGEIDDTDRDFAWKTIEDLIDDLEASDETRILAGFNPSENTKVEILGIPSSDHADLIALRMLRLLLADRGVSISLRANVEKPLQLVDAISSSPPSTLILSHLPPTGLTETRYLTRRLRAKFPQMNIIVGRWGEGGNTEGASDQLVSAGATKVVFSLSEAALALAPGTTSETDPTPEDENIGAPGATATVANLPG